MEHQATTCVTISSRVLTLLVILAVAPLAANGSGSCFSPPAGLVGWWPGDGNARDIQGTNHGTLQGGATATAAGKVAQAFSLDGTNGYVQIPDTAALRPANLTVEAWVLFSSLNSAASGSSPPGQQYIVFKQNTRNDKFEGFYLGKERRATGDVLVFRVSSSAGKQVEVASSPMVVTGVWYHVAGVRGPNSIQLYTNGQLVGQASVSSAQNYGNFPLYFGTSGQSRNDHKLKGLLDEVSLYNRALSSSEIASIYAAGDAGKCKAVNIITQPQSQSVTAGSNALFTVVAAGTAPLSYQWRFNGVAVAGATNTNLALLNVQSANGGNYTVVLTNPVGSVTSSVAVLTVVAPPVITTQPQSQTKVIGTTASFSATAAGSAPLGYQWRLNGTNLANGGRISGARTTTLIVSTVQPADSGSYTLMVSNAVGVVASAVATLTVISPPAITAQPASQSVTAGTNASFTVTASGTLPLSYQWLVNGTNLADGSQFSGSTNSMLFILNVQASNAGSYSVVVTNAAGSVTSTVAALTVIVPGSCLPPPVGLIGWWPADGNASDITGPNNGTLQGGATANAAGMVAQAFGFNGTNSYVQIPDSPMLRPTNFTIETWVRFSSLNSAGSGGSPAGDQYLVFKQNSRSSDFEGFDLSKMRVTGGDVFRFLVVSATAQTAAIYSSTLLATGVWYHVVAVRGPNFTQLYVNGHLEGQTNVGFAQDYGTLPLYFGTSGQSYWDHKLNGLLDEVSLYNRALSANEVAAIYSAGAAGKCKAVNGLTITTQPQSQSVVVGSPAVFTLAAAGAAPLNYQWRFNGADLPGATSTSLTLAGVQPANAGSYTVVVTNSAASATSAVAVLTVLVPPAITEQPQSLTTVTGTLASFSATATGSAPLDYQWQLNELKLANGGRISGATSNTLAIAGVEPADTGRYTLLVSNAAGVVTSAVATLTVSGPPVITRQPASQSVAAGNNVTFSVTTAGTLPLSYQWRWNGVDLADGGNLSGATSAALTLANVQTNDTGSYQVAITNSEGSATSALASLTVTSPLQPVSQSAGAVVLVNSHSANYLDFQHFIQPYLDNFGFPYSVQDIATNVPGPGISNCAVIIIGHSQLDTNRSYLNSTAQAAISQAVSNGTGLVSFDSDLSAGTTPRYQFVQDIFGFGYAASATSGSSVSLPPTEPLSQMHYITARHPANDSVALRSSISLPGLTLASNATAVALSGGRPFVAAARYGQGHAVQWTSYAWMPAAVLGPLEGLDDLVWRGVVWSARKPFVMRGLPNLVVLRMDDVSGPFWWVHAANQMGFKPWLGLFLSNVAEANTTDLRGLVTNGNATASVHSWDCCNTFFYFNHNVGPWPDNVMSDNYYAATQWHNSHGIPVSRFVTPHYAEMGPNAFAGLKAWGVEFFGTTVVPGTEPYLSPPAPWLIGGPYRLYETTQAATVNWPVWYADFLSVPGHPEFNGQFFNCYTEVRDDSSCNEWCPADNDVAGTIGRGTRQVKRGLDSMVMGQLYTHEWYIIPIPQSSNQTPISSNNWSAILQGITNNLGAYTPNYVTMDYACQYVRATRTSRLLNSGYDPASGQVTVTLSGTADLDTSVYVFVGADNAISSSFGIVPVFSGSVTNTVARLGAQPRSLSIITQPPTLTYGLTAKGEFRLVIAGQPLQQYAIEVSDDLVNWAELTTVTLQDGTALLNAPAIASGQFYRARRLP